jgi:hypothetical protein
MWIGLAVVVACSDNVAPPSREPSAAPGSEQPTREGTMMESVMLQFRYPGHAPSLADVARLFNLKANEIDAEFGVIATDPIEGLYTVLIDARARKRVEAVLATRPHDPAEGIFANPRIEPFGPPEE